MAEEQRLDYGETDPALVWALVLDGTRSARETDWAGVRAWKPDAGVLWVHLNRMQPEAQRWILTEAGLDSIAANALLAEDPRPRTEAFGEGRVIILRGVNLNPGADPEDMVSMRLWVDARRVITVRRRTVMAIRDVRGRLDGGSGPRTAGGLLAQLSECLITRMGPVIDALQETLDDLEERISEGMGTEIFRELSAVRRQAVMLRRHLAPQREATGMLVHERASWLEDGHRAGLREVTNRLMRYVEDLDAVRERAAVAQEEFHTQMSERLNRNMYALTAIAAIFLPLSLLTGLLGINVGGIPGADNPLAFLAVCLILVVIAIGQVALFRWQKWL